MAYPVITGAILELQLRYVIQAQQCLNTFHYKLGTGGDITAAIMGQFLDTFETNITSFFAPRVTLGVTQIRVRGQFVYPTRFVHTERSALATEGTIDEQTWTIGSSIVMRRRSDVASRSARGRVYVGGLPVSAYLNGIIDGAVVADWQGTFASGMLEAVSSPLLGSDADPVIWSHTDPTNADLITSVQTDANVRYQRRREVGRGK